MHRYTHRQGRRCGPGCLRTAKKASYTCTSFSLSANLDPAAGRSTGAAGRPRDDAAILNYADASTARTQTHRYTRIQAHTHGACLWTTGTQAQTTPVTCMCRAQTPPSAGACLCRSRTHSMYCKQSESRRTSGWGGTHGAVRDTTRGRGQTAAHYADEPDSAPRWSTWPGS
jgi:hypothetical protein